MTEQTETTDNPVTHFQLRARTESCLRAAENALHLGEYDAAIAWINRAGAAATELKERAQ